METIKYPRSVHLPWSQGATSDDKIIAAEDFMHLKSLPEFVVTEKMDGGNLTMYREHFHARSLDSGTHLWDTAAKRLWSTIRFGIPEGWRVSGESMYARRSVAYQNLPSVFLIFGVWDEDNSALDWTTVTELAEELGVPTVPVLYRGDSFKEAVKVWPNTREPETSEGFVLRSAAGFAYEDFSKNLAKYVRANHARTRADWRHRDDFELNGFAGGEQ